MSFNFSLQSVTNIIFACLMPAAFEGIDYVSLTEKIVFTKYSENPYHLYIPIINDCDCVEEYEYFSVNITTDMDCVHLPVDHVNITIVDDDSEFLQHCITYKMDETVCV